MAIPDDSTIQSVAHLLSKPEDYVCGVLDHMLACQRAYGDSTVRIGILGNGSSPHYRVEYPPEAAGTPMPGIFEAYDGRSHKKLVEEDVLQDHTWSSAVSTVRDVQDVLGDIRAKKKGLR